MKFLKRITTANMMGVVGNLAEINGKEKVIAELEKREPKYINEVELYIVLGTVKGYDIKTGTFGESYGFVGSFDAVNIQTGEVAKAGVAYFSSPVDVAIRDMVDEAFKKGGDVSIPIKVKVDAIPHGGERGYQYRNEVAFEDEQAQADRVRQMALAAFGKTIRSPLALAPPKTPEPVAGPGAAPTAEPAKETKPKK